MHHIKKYANRKLYDSTDKRYISMTKLSDVIRQGEDIIIIDNETGKDLTASIVSGLIARTKDQAEQTVSSSMLIRLFRRGGAALTDYTGKHIAGVNKNNMDKTLKQIPIILTAFGTTTKAFAIYKKMDKIFQKTFLTNKIYWTYSSGIVKHTIKKNKNIVLKCPLEMTQTLADQGHQWVIIQSLHLTCGHEFDRLVAQRDHVNIRSAIGLPLLASYKDYEKTATALRSVIPEDENQAVVMVGHGSDHPSWSTYPAFENVLRQKYGNKMFVGVLKYSHGMNYTLDRIKSAGFKKVSLIPLLLVAGAHFEKDITNREDSWQKTFERNNIKVSIVDRGLGDIDDVTKIFCDHIIDALNVIPL